jgi:small subunit ribosomal protein S6
LRYTGARFLPCFAPTVPDRRLPARPTQTEGREVSGTVIAYEILLMLDPELAEERQNEIVARTRELVEKGGGTWSGQDPWGRRKLAYEIDHKPEGVYHLLTFETDPETLAEISRVLKITDGVMRHMAVRRVAGGRPQPVATAPRPAVQEPR